MLQPKWTPQNVLKARTGENGNSSVGYDENWGGWNGGRLDQQYIILCMYEILKTSDFKSTFLLIL